MRGQGWLSGPVECGPADHVCLVYDDPAQFATAAGQFLAGGLARGERLVHVGSGADHDLLRRAGGPLGPAGTVDGLVADGTLTLLRTETAYQGDGAFTPDQQLSFYAVATGDALAAGRSGLRVVAELSALAADAGRRPQLVRWEHVADGFMAGGSGMSAMCAYRRGAVPDEALTEVGAVHPQVHAPSGTDAEALVPFRVYADDGRIVVAGCVDAFGAHRLHTTLTDSVDCDAGTTLDLGGLTFADAAGCRAIVAWAGDQQRQGRRVRLVGATPFLARLWRLLGYDAVAPLAERRGPA